MKDEAPSFRVETVDAAPPVPRARVEDTPLPESAGNKLERKKDYLEGFLAAQPTGIPAGQPGGDL